MFRVIRKIVLAYFAATGLLAHIALVIGFFAVLNYLDLTPSQFLYKAAEKSGLDIPWAVEALSPAPQFTGHVLDGNVRPGHPRILLPALAQWDGQGMPGLMQKRVARYKRQGMEDFDPCKTGGGVMALAACWVSSGDTEVAERLRVTLKNFQLQSPDVQARYGNAWELALAYDLLSLYPALDDNDRVQLEAKIEYALREYLTLLDDPSPSLWHGRTSLAAMAWLCAVVLDPKGSHQRPQLIARAQGHFLDVVRAAELTEGWPEGYNYWIQNRAFVFTLAASAYLNGLEDAVNQARIRKLLRRIGLWHIYATRPDNRIEGLGDEGSRVDLKDETRRVMDIIAQATQDPVFATFSRYLEALHGKESYYRGYRWGFRLFNDPTLDTGANDGQGLAVFAGLPQTELFGRGGLNLAYIHSDWLPDATFISFRAGQTFTHHGHYDAGHFSLFKQAPLAINSSTYGGGFTSPHRLNYAIRTVAKNSLLILRPGEQVRPNRFFTNNVADGGQRVIIPTGSGVRSVADWAANRTEGKYFTGGQVESFDYKRDRYAYISADLTKAYNTPEHDEGGRGGKVRSVQRELVYLFDEDRLIVHDSVVSTEADYTKKWLLHTVNRPHVDTEKVLKGSRNNGISESHEAVATVKNGKGYLRVDRLYPEDAVMRLVGGPDYQFYVESDGDDSDLDGDNFTEGMSLKPWFDVGMWRIEIQPGAPRVEDEFLVVLTPGKPSQRKGVVHPLSLRGAPAKGLATPKHLVVFVDQAAHGELQIPSPGKARQLLVFGVPANMQVELQGQSTGSELRSNAEGVLALVLGKGGSPVTLRW
jgi:hypothetical protein